MTPLTRRHLLALVIIGTLAGAASMLLSSCGAPKHIDPPTLTYPTELMARLSAEARAKDIGGTVYRVADTHSMEPLLIGRDYIVVAPPSRAPYADLKVGQVITYKADWYAKHPVTHRLVQKDKDGWILSGDNNPRSEASWRVTAGTYLGTVDGIYRVRP